MENFMGGFVDFYDSRGLGVMAGLISFMGGIGVVVMCGFWAFDKWSNS